MAGKPWSEERKAAAARKRAAAKVGAPPAKPAARRGAAGKDPVAEAVETIAGVLAMPLMSLGARNEAFLADALTLEMNAVPFGTAMAEVAKVNPRLGEFFERGAPATPYILLGTVLFSMGTQFAANHGVNLGPLAGSVTPRALMIAAAKERVAEQQRLMDEQNAMFEDMQKMENERLAREAQEQARADAAAELGPDTAQVYADAVSAESPVI